MEKHVPKKFAMLIHITKKGIKTITCSNYLANMNSIFVKLDVLKLKDIIAYKTYLLSLQSQTFRALKILVLFSQFVNINE